MYSSEYTSGFSGPASLHLAAPPSPRHEGNAGQAPAGCEEPTVAHETIDDPSVWHNRMWLRRMLKKFVQQGRSE
jgi:hypothetical protein